jgi:hypothetical protein
MRERCECGKANCIYCNPVDIPARPELLEQIEQLQTENQRLRDGLGELIDKPDYTNLSGRIVPEGIVYAIKQLLEGGSDEAI